MWLIAKDGDVVDVELIEKLYDACHNDIYKIARAKLGKAQEAEDCLQRVFTLALEKADVLQRHPAPDKWLYKTANTLSKEMLRKDKHVKKNEVFVEDIETHSVSIPLEEEVQAFVMRAKAEAVDIGKFLNDTLTPDEHRLYQLRYYEKCRTGQIAELLGIRHSAARVRLARLKAKVDRAVKKYLHE